MFFDALDVDYKREDLPDYVVQKYKYLFFNPTWFNHERLTLERKVNLAYYWFAVVPGCGGIVLKRNDKPVPLWQMEHLLKPYLCVLKKVQMYYSLMRVVIVPDMKEFVGSFCARNEIAHLTGFLIYSMGIYNVPVVIDVNVSNEDKKRSGRVFKIAEMMIANLPTNMIENFEVEVPDTFKDFFTEGVENDTGGVSRSSLGTTTNYSYGIEKESTSSISPPVQVNVTPDKSENTSKGIGEKVTNVPIVIHRVPDVPVNNVPPNTFVVGDSSGSSVNGGAVTNKKFNGGVDIFGDVFSSDLFDQ